MQTGSVPLKSTPTNIPCLTDEEKETREVKSLVLGLKVGFKLTYCLLYTDHAQMFYSL